MASLKQKAALNISLCFSLAWAAIPSRAITPGGSCGQPFLFPQASVNIVILPYQRISVDSNFLSATGDRLSVLVEIQAFYSAMKFGGAGVVRLVQAGQDAQCDEDDVFLKLLGRAPGALSGKTLRSGNAVVLVWGRLYEEGDDVYAQTYIRFLRFPGNEEFRLDFGDLELSGRLPSQVFALAPRHLSQHDLVSIHGQFSNSAVLRAGPESVQRRASLA
jgi:hypothetical protein